MGAYAEKERKHGAEYRALWAILSGKKSGLDMSFFGAPCPICGRKTSAIWVKECRDWTVDCHCKACGAAKEAICAAIGFDPLPYAVDRIFDEEMKRMAALDVIGANRCTACEHYLSVDMDGGKKLYGCKIKNLYRMNELFEGCGDSECRMYAPDRDALMKGISDADAYIAAYRRTIAAYEERREKLTALLNEK